jgi:putative transposase
VRRLRQLEQENAKLKKLIAERDLEIEVMKEVAAGRRAARHRQVAYGCGRGLAIRRACALMSVARSMLRHESRLVKRDAPAVAVMRELVAQ